MPLNEGAVNEIKPFAGEGLVAAGDLISLEEYAAHDMRIRGHQPGIASRGLANRQGRQAAHMAAGLAQFIANRYAAGVKDDGDLDKVEEGLRAVIEEMISAGVPGPASPQAPGLVPAGGTAGQIYSVSEDGTEYGFFAPKSADTILPGFIMLLPFRPEDLAEHAPGWRFCNGDLYPLSGDVGETLAALPENFKDDWGIVVSGVNISIPNMFHSDGRGYFLRAANGAARLIGSVETDAIRNITGALSYVPHSSAYMGASGAFGVQNQGQGNTGSGGASHYVDFNAARVVATASENRPLNIGMTPAIYLGV